MAPNNPSSSDIEHRDPPRAFDLQRMEGLFDQSDGRNDAPHRHRYYTVLVVEKATGQHRIDYHAYDFAPGQVHFIAPGQVHQVLTPSRPHGWVITFSADFLLRNNIPTRFISDINLFQQFGDHPPLSVAPAELAQLTSLIDQMATAFTADHPYRDRALGAWLQLFLIRCNQFCPLAPSPSTSDSHICLLRDFKARINASFHEWHKVQDYAADLHITPKHLSQVVKQLTGSTAKELIQQRLVLEGKRLLFHTDLSVKEIAYRLGFEEPLHFSGFFKRQSGHSPSEFRRLHLA